MYSYVHSCAQLCTVMYSYAQLCIFCIHQKIVAATVVLKLSCGASQTTCFPKKMKRFYIQLFRPSREGYDDEVFGPPATEKPRKKGAKKQRSKEAKRREAGKTKTTTKTKTKAKTKAETKTKTETKTASFWARGLGY